MYIEFMTLMLIYFVNAATGAIYTKPSNPFTTPTDHHKQD